MSAPAAGRPTLVLVAAVASNGAIGKDNRLLWHLPEDLRHFREATRGHAVVMGRRTWESLPPRFRPLPDRRNLVLTRDAAWSAEGAERAGSVDEALARLAGGERAFVIGGAEVYAAFLPLADELLLTEVDRACDGDAWFPAWDRRAYEELSRRAHPATDATPGFAIVRYRRRAGAPLAPQPPSGRGR